MENNAALEFLAGYDDRYPPEFSRRYEAMECLSCKESAETLLVRENATGRFFTAKCYEKGHTLFETTEPEEFRRLSHPGLPAFAGEYRSDTMRCILREYVPGDTLWSLGRERTFSRDDVLHTGLELCGILRYLHRQTPPVIHRDIKPQNIVRRGDGSLALIDLGISRLFAEGAPSDTLYCGTRDFAPPEQYGFLQTDCRSDIYSLGILLSWMLTGKAEPIRAPETPLERVIAKCTAFAPENRFRDASTAEQALAALRPAARKRKRIRMGIAGILALALLIPCGIWLNNRPSVPVSEAGFSEPIIEKAVRLMLGKGPDDLITKAELATVTELYITKDTPCSDMETYSKIHEEQCAANFNSRGSITSLRDLKLLPNLRILCVASEQIDDISPLSSLPGLFQAELRFNNVSDISPLAGLDNLAFVGLNSNPVADLSPLSECKALQYLDLCNADSYSGDDLQALGNFEFLDISNDTDSYLYLGGKRIRELKISNTSAFTDLSFLRDVTGLERLEVCNTDVSDLSELVHHPDITYLRLCGTPAADFSVLLQLPKLETLTVSSSMEDLVESAAAEGSFSVEYE
ncbi:protein kinase domain-containing protein [Papillibacter cinnamivorans]|uniref:non-specific serine/threonine protein kinase n=1 Tax=Papillibacter cinnamivorans DSM 12816 TaxID=1122930 RepID=A0A1W2BB83_9FIRM|nr:protein kinase [Papillibacter cinnamivorans]SMC70283.1 Protein kinase domain-containing protein [Papillibacter cinnamivorans DSM 12816]